MLSQPHKHLPHGCNQRLIGPLNPSSVLVSHTVYVRSCHIRTWAGRKDLANWEVIHLDTSNSNGWAATAARVCRTLVEADGSSLNWQGLEFELALYKILSPATRRLWHSNQKLWSGQSLDTEYTSRSRSWRWHSAADPHTGEQYSRIGRTNTK